MTFFKMQRDATGKTMVAPNGLNLSRSVTNPASRLRRVMAYLLAQPAPMSRDMILRDVFGIYQHAMRSERVATPKIGSLNVRGRGWGTYLFVLMVNHGYIKKVGAGRYTKYTVA